MLIRFLIDVVFAVVTVAFFAIWAASVLLHFRPCICSFGLLSLCLEVCLSFVICVNISLLFIQLLINFLMLRYDRNYFNKREQ